MELCRLFVNIERHQEDNLKFKMTASLQSVLKIAMDLRERNRECKCKIIICCPLYHQLVLTHKQYIKVPEALRLRSFVFQEQLVQVSQTNSEVSLVYIVISSAMFQ